MVTLLLTIGIIIYIYMEKKSRILSQFNDYYVNSMKPVKHKQEENNKNDDLFIIKNASRRVSFDSDVEYNYYNKLTSLNNIEISSVVSSDKQTNNSEKTGYSSDPFNGGYPIDDDKNNINSTSEFESPGNGVIFENTLVKSIDKTVKLTQNGSIPMASNETNDLNEENNLNEMYNQTIIDKNTQKQFCDKIKQSHNMYTKSFSTMFQRQTDKDSKQNNGLDPLNDIYNKKNKVKPLSNPLDKNLLNQYDSLLDIYKANPNDKRLVGLKIKDIYDKETENPKALPKKKIMKKNGMIYYKDETEMNGGVLNGSNGMIGYSNDENIFDNIRYNGDFTDANR